jgi:hypothetical protein
MYSPKIIHKQNGYKPMQSQSHPVIYSKMPKGAGKDIGREKRHGDPVIDI